MSSPSYKNTNEMPINNRPTFEPNNLYYGLRPKYINGRAAGIDCICVKVDKRSRRLGWDDKSN